MNAYELADELENKDRLWAVDENLMLNTCEMLRHQADYIKHLEDGLKASIALNKAQLERLSNLERKHKEEFNYAEKLLKEQNK